MIGAKKVEFKYGAMGKYPLSDNEKRRIIDLLEDQTPSRREVIMRNASNFASWLAGACYDIWIKIKTFFSNIGDAIGDFIYWLLN